ncbi:hypothetical protein [Streptomyces sp. HC307]|uniref:hypothetical protein n=1 Tax=Streptomyces flavusporus TaxID=3385496 RepID=UPI003916FDEB
MFVHTRREREVAVGTWLLLSAQSADRARMEWKKGGIALLRCGALFAAIRMNGDLVRAAADTDDAERVDAFLEEALCGGPVFVDQHSAQYYALVPASMQDRREWRERRHLDGTKCLGRDSYLGVPRPEFTEPDHHFSYWCVSMDGPGDLCPVEAVSQLVTYGQYRLATAEARSGA